MPAQKALLRETEGGRPQTMRSLGGGIVRGGAFVIRDAAIAVSADSLAVHTFRVSSPLCMQKQSKAGRVCWNYSFVFVLPSLVFVLVHMLNLVWWAFSEEKKEEGLTRWGVMALIKKQFAEAEIAVIDGMMWGLVNHGNFNYRMTQQSWSVMIKAFLYESERERVNSLKGRGKEMQAR